ncbi:MAG TPA: hypothetical protein VE010_08360 [Thermoanaerobaculia bacterium]|nr:hypothetical protein [Thermoanaerobaculia bacterium]
MKRTFALVLMILAATAAAPVVDAQRAPAYQCAFNNDCANPLVCANGFCRAQCTTDRDCHNGWVCRTATVINPVTEGSGAANIIPGTDMNRCVAPGTENLVRQENNRFIPLPLGSQRSSGGVIEAAPANSGTTTSRPTAVAVAVPATPANPGYAVPQGTVAPAAPIVVGGYEFRRGESDYLWIRSEGGEWTNVGAGVLASDPSAVQTSDGAIHVFALGLDQAVWTVSCVAGACSDWLSLGGVLTAPPTATTDEEGQLEVSAIGTDGRVWVNSGRGKKWSGWNPKQ